METDTKMDTKDAATPAATAPTAVGINPTTTEDEDEMPLLFMDQLPSSFAQSAQLAALATFMDSDGQESASEAGNDSKRRRQRHRKAKRRQKSYAKQEKEPKNMKNGVEAKSADTKELQLFLSLFHVS